AALADWLAGRGLLAPGEAATRGELLEAIGVREALRDLLAAQSGLEADVEAATTALDAAASRAKLSLHFAAGRAEVAPGAGGVRGAIGRILVEVAAAMADGTWERMKACRATDCRWAFLDEAKNRSRAWCSMQSCGNREKVRAYRERHAH
ncbi:MAG: CGNR zinc finger domain-containing protein, partial [Actinobacteria bacterium]|nr:CGNR zinc finger domain-containing protein [Actinomycetota bacterium]